MTPPRFATIMFTIEDGGIQFEVEDARLEVAREVNRMGRRTGASLAVRFHIVVDLNAGPAMNDIAIRLFNSSIQANEVVQKFKVEWANPLTGAGADTIARQLTFSGWVCNYELYRPQGTGASSPGTAEATTRPPLGRADQLLHATFAVVVDDDNFGNLVLSS